MNLTWCMLALALTGTDERTSTKTSPAKAPAGIARAANPCNTTQLDPECQEIWPMTLPAAIEIALDNSEIVRVIRFGEQGMPAGNCFGPPEKPHKPRERPASIDPRSIVIEPLSAGADTLCFKSETMALVRSAEQQYWNLAQAHAALWAADSAVNIAHEVLTAEQIEPPRCPRGIDCLAEATDHLERFEHDLIEQTTAVKSAERLLREILGLPRSDNRRIIPVTPPTEARLEPDWETCLQTMMHNQPDVIQQKLLTRLAELQLLIARHRGLVPPLNLNTLYQMNTLGQMLESSEDMLMSAFLAGLEVGSTKKLKRLTKELARSSSVTVELSALVALEQADSQLRPLANTRQAQFRLLRSRAFLGQVIHQTTHSLARAFLKVDAGFKSYATAESWRRTAEERLAQQRAYWEAGRITPDRFLDAVEQYADAVVAEHQSLATYNTSIAFLSECKGTLLADENIIVAEHERRDKSEQAAEKTHDDQTQQASFTPAALPSPNPTFLDLWQVSTCPWLLPSSVVAPEESVNAPESTPATKH